MRQHLDDESQENLEKIPLDKFELWGHDGVWSPCDLTYSQKTEVRDGESAIKAFKFYTEYFHSIMDNWTPDSNTLVLVPCGSSKPIGSSTIHQKKVNAIRNGGLQGADVVIVSEPCTIIPSEYRLSLPAVNYDFPPEYTVEENYPEVFQIFTDRLARWLDTMDYDTIYPYLISGHQSKFDASLEKMETNPTVYEIPSASYNPETDSYSGDRFKKQTEITQKVKSVLRYKANNHSITVKPEFAEFYQNRWTA